MLAGFSSVTKLTGDIVIRVRRLGDETRNAMKPNGMGPGMAWPESQVVQPQQTNGVREREAATDNQRLKRRPSSDDGNMGLPVVQNSAIPTNLGSLKVPGKDALSFAAVLRSRNKISGMYVRRLYLSLHVVLFLSFR